MEKKDELIKWINYLINRRLSQVGRDTPELQSFDDGYLFAMRHVLHLIDEL